MKMTPRSSAARVSSGLPVSSDMKGITLSVDAAYVSGRKIQLRESFDATLTASYKIKILQIGETPIEISLPIEVKIRGMSEVYWRE